MEWRPDLLVICRRGHAHELAQLGAQRACPRKMDFGEPCREAIRLAPDCVRAAALLGSSRRLGMAEEIWRTCGESWADLDMAP